MTTVLASGHPISGVLRGRVLPVLMDLSLSGLLVLCFEMDLILVAFERCLRGKCKPTLMTNELLHYGINRHHPCFNQRLASRADANILSTLLRRFRIVK